MQKAKYLMQTPKKDDIWSIIEFLACLVSKENR